ncbi:MAG: thioesterase family protein [Chitinophagales bacterium]
MSKEKLIDQKTIRIRFSETDALGMVWHGNYIKFFEDGRDSFGEKYDLNWLEIHDLGFVTPIVKTVCEHKCKLRYGDKIRIETEFIDEAAAKIHFKFRIYNTDTGKLAATGETLQVFTDKDGELVLTNPEFYVKWKKRWNLLD